jgi:ornithine carbamoyltransferase
VSGHLAAAPRHFLDLWPLSGLEMRALLDAAKARKAARAGLPKARPDVDRPLDGRLLAMIFEKPSTRTRASFDVAMRQLGGVPAVYNASDLQLGRGETVEDTARVLSRFVDAVMIRANSHATIVDFAGAADVPVINGLTDKSHPCQILADLLTFEEKVGPIAGARLAWVGDGNNVCASFIHAAPKLGYELTIAAPLRYAPPEDDIARARAEGAVIAVTDDPVDAVRGADAVITDTWVSMGDLDRDERLATLEAFRVDAALMAHAAKHAIFLHCLPAHRAEEVTADVIDGPRSVVFDEAENRVHAQKAVLLWCFGL